MTLKRPVIHDVLAHRYASTAMLHLWSPEGRIVRERELWIAIMKAQRALGLDIPEEAISAYERVAHQVDLESIDARERLTRHDVKARIEEFCALAGVEHIHKGMTSRDLTDNVEQLQVRHSLELLRDKTVAALAALAALSARFRDTPLVARTHHVPAQPTTLGRRFAMYGEEILHGLQRLESTLAAYPLRGLKGAVGTRLDQITLMGGVDKAKKLEQAAANRLGFAHVLENVGQVYPRSLDFEVISAAYQLGAGLADFAKGVRLMTGHELVSEGFKKGQVGSSAMPHKMNARNCERINGFQTLLAGYLEMVSRLAGDQWNEGDVSCSVVRRVALPSAMFALDGQLETFLTVLNEMEVFEASLAAEVRRQLPFLATTTLMMEAVKRGAGREAAHEIIKRHAVDVARELRNGLLAENDLARRLGKDGAFPLSQTEVEALLANPSAFLGGAPEQVDYFVAQVDQVRAAHPHAAGYTPEAIV
ncbi:MAG: adenylosuccinate lyase [Deltaproteobacteria bacterium]|nr:adenylosuccinate lyase [Deltaproteobacteria bacterium]